MKEYKIDDKTTSSELSQMMAEVEIEQNTHREAMALIDEEIAQLSIQATEILLKKKNLEPVRLKAQETARRLDQTYNMLKRNYFLQGKRGL